MNITFIGIGKLGLGLALLLEKAGHNILGIDINEEYIDLLNTKKLKTKEPKYEELLHNSKNFRATKNLKEGLEFSDIIFVLVQTPNSGGSKFYDHSILSNLLEKINTYKVENKQLLICCTVMPKYIDNIGTELIKDCKNTYLSYNPEFVAQGNIINGYLNSDIILLGTRCEKLKKIIQDIFRSIMDKEPVWCFMTPLESEIVKITINGYITTKISFANMISDLCDTVGADKYIVLRAVGSDTRICNKYFLPGKSFGGPCFPRDTKALLMFVEDNFVNGNLLKATTEYNQEHIKFEVKKLLEQNLEEYIIKDICYKPNSKIPIIEESANLKIAYELVKSGKKVIIEDEINLIKKVQKEYGKIFKYNIIKV